MSDRCTEPSQYSELKYAAIVQWDLNMRYPAVLEVLGGAVITQVAAVITPNAYSTEFSRRNRTTSLISSAPSSN